MRLKTYIAGPMTGIDKLNRPAFQAAAEQLHRDLGRVVINPVILPAGLGGSPTTWTSVWP